MTDSNSPYNSGSTVTVLNNSFTKTNANFYKWNTAADGTGTDYDPSDTFTITSNVTLYAQWITYSIKNFGGVDSSLADTDIRLEFREIEADVPTQSERRPGYTYPVSQTTFNQTLSEAVNANGGIYKRNEGTYTLHVVIKVPNSTTGYRIVLQEIVGYIDPDTGIHWIIQRDGDRRDNGENLYGLMSSDLEYRISCTFTGLTKDYMVTCEEV